MAAPANSNAVFLSYASEDMKAARLIAEALRCRHIEVWFDQSELRGGDAWDAKIRKQIRDCVLFIAVISGNTEVRPKGYFRREWKLAVETMRDLADDVPFLVPVAIDATPEASARVPEKFQELQWTRLPDGQPTEEFVAHIVRLLSARNVMIAPAPAMQPEPALASSPMPAPPATSTAAAGLPVPTVTPAIRTPSGSAANPRLSLGQWRTVGLAATAVLGIATGWLLRPLLPPPPSAEGPALWLNIAPPHRSFHIHAAPSISPDGRQIAFWAQDEANRTCLWVRSLDSPVARRLPETVRSAGDFAVIPAFWSPDGRSLGFFADKKLKRIDVAGGSPQTLAEAANPRGGTWTDNGVILFAPASGAQVQRIPASGGTAVALGISTTLDESHTWPHALPGGRQFLVKASSGGRARVLLASLDDAKSRTLSTEVSRFEYANGHVFFGRNRSLFAQRFSEQTSELVGEPFRVGDHLGHSFGDPAAFAFSVSRTGTIVYWNGPSVPVTQLTWFSRNGQRLGTLGEAGEYVGIAVSPDLKQVVVERRDPAINEANLWLFDDTTKVGTKFSSGIDEYRVYRTGTPVWSPRGDSVLFVTFPGLAEQSVKGGPALKLFDGRGWLEDLHPDGKIALWTSYSAESAGDLWTLNLEGEKVLQPYLVTKANDWCCRYSPDGRWVAYTSNDADRDDIYVQSFPAPGRALRVSRDGGVRPEWRSDGRELYFLSPEGKLMAVAVERTESGLQVSAPQPLFSVATGTDFGRKQYHPALDGERFLVNAIAEDTTPRFMTVLTQWQPPRRK